MNYCQLCGQGYYGSLHQCPSTFVNYQTTINVDFQILSELQKISGLLEKLLELTPDGTL